MSERRLANPDPFPAFLISFNACRPTSRGHLTLASADPFAPPAIHPNYLSTAHDLAEARQGIALLNQIIAAQPLADIVTGRLVPGAEVQSEADWIEDFRARADTVYHPTSTCMMGPDAATAVVDARLRVHGVEGLRVIDASVFPTITSGNTNAPTVMVAEKGAAMVGDHSKAVGDSDLSKTDAPFVMTLVMTWRVQEDTNSEGNSHSSPQFQSLIWPF